MWSEGLTKGLRHACSQNARVMLLGMISHYYIICVTLRAMILLIIIRVTFQRVLLFRVSNHLVFVLIH